MRLKLRCDPIRLALTQLLCSIQELYPQCIWKFCLPRNNHIWNHPNFRHSLLRFEVFPWCRYPDMPLKNRRWCDDLNREGRPKSEWVCPHPTTWFVLIISDFWKALDTRQTLSNGIKWSLRLPFFYGEGWSHYPVCLGWRVWSYKVCAWSVFGKSSIRNCSSRGAADGMMMVPNAELACHSLSRSCKLMKMKDRCWISELEGKKTHNQVPPC